MKKYYLNNLNLVNRIVSDHIKISKSYDEFEIQFCIDLFNKKIEWEKMFDLNQAKERLNDNEIFYVAKYYQKIFGYAWIKHIDNNSLKIYNIFSNRENEKNPYGATDMIFLILNEFQKNTFFYAEVDEWNIKSQRVFEKLGFVKSD